MVWQAGVALTGVSELILPSPVSVLKAGVRIREPLVAATVRTSLAAIMGLLVSSICGILAAFVFSISVTVRRSLYPYAVLLQTVPIIAIAPIVILTFGRGFFSIAIIASIISLFPVITNTTTGLLQTDQNLAEFFRLHRATWLQTLLKLRLPSALPYMITGIRIASGTAIVGAVVGEFFVGSGQPGLGSVIRAKTESLELPELYATVATTTALGTLVFMSISAAGEYVLDRWFGMSLEAQHSK